MTVLRKSSIPALSLILLAGCGGGGGGGTGSIGPGGGPSGPLIAFASTSQDVDEDGGAVDVTVRLSEVQAQDVPFTLAVGGTAVEGTDYGIDLGALTIPAGDLETTLTVTPFPDQECEPSETVEVVLLAAAGVGLGAARTHTLRVIDGDTQVFTELELNDGVASANPVGEVDLGSCFEIQGTIAEGAPDPFDVFRFTSGAAVRVTVELRPLGGAMDLVLFITDGIGDLIQPPVQHTGVGEVESVTFEVDSAWTPEFNLSVSSFGPVGGYAMRVIGSAPSPAPLTEEVPRVAGGPSAAQPWSIGWSELKESLRPASDSDAARATLEAKGPGLWLELDTGELRRGVWLGTR